MSERTVNPKRELSEREYAVPSLDQGPRTTFHLPVDSADMYLTLVWNSLAISICLLCFYNICSHRIYPLELLWVILYSALCFFWVKRRGGFNKYLRYYLFVFSKSRWLEIGFANDVPVLRLKAMGVTGEMVVEEIRRDALVKVGAHFGQGSARTGENLDDWWLCLRAEPSGTTSFIDEVSLDSLHYLNLSGPGANKDDILKRANEVVAFLSAQEIFLDLEVATEAELKQAYAANNLMLTGSD